MSCRKYDIGLFHTGLFHTLGEIPTRSPQRGRQIDMGYVNIGDFLQHLAVS